ncbi:MAG: hypothetical protein EOP33_00450 [Rickettsiaceae bacterium]|nr:MAG: hypothetical protein EOP33_00450 [Rickettsiaceae bacterium]
MPIDTLAIVITAIGVTSVANAAVSAAHDKRMKDLLKSATANKKLTLDEIKQKVKDGSWKADKKSIATYAHSEYSKYLVNQSEDEAKKAKQEAKKAHKAAITATEQANFSAKKSEKEKQDLEYKVKVLERRLSQLTQSGDYNEADFEDTDQLPLLTLSPGRSSFFGNSERSKSPIMKSRPHSGDGYGDSIISPKVQGRRSSQDNHRTSNKDDWSYENDSESSSNKGFSFFSSRRHSADGDSKTALSPRAERSESPLKNRPASSESKNLLSPKSHSRNSSQDTQLSDRDTSSNSSDYEGSNFFYDPPSSPSSKTFSLFGIRRKSTDQASDNNLSSPKGSSSFFGHRRNSTDQISDNDHSTSYTSNIEQDQQLQSSPKSFSIFGSRSRRNSSDSENEYTKSPLLKSKDLGHKNTTQQDQQLKSLDTSPHLTRYNDTEKSKRNSHEDKKNSGLPTITESHGESEVQIKANISPEKFVTPISLSQSGKSSKTEAKVKKSLFGNLSVNVEVSSLDDDIHQDQKTPKTPIEGIRKTPQASKTPKTPGNDLIEAPKTPKNSFFFFGKKSHDKESTTDKLLEKNSKPAAIIAVTDTKSEAKNISMDNSNTTISVDVKTHPLSINDVLSDDQNTVYIQIEEVILAGSAP